MPNKQKKFQQIIDSSMEFAQAKDVDLLLGKILHVAKNLANAETGSIYIMEQEILKFHHTQTDTGKEQSTSKKPAIYNGSLIVTHPDSLSAYVARTGEVVNIPDVSKLPEDAPYSIESSPNEDSSHQVLSILAFPLNNNHGEAIGVIQLINPRNQEGEILPLSEDDVPLLQLFANNAANAIERAQTTRSRVLGIIQLLTALRDTEETVAHVNRVGAYASEIYDIWAQKKGIPQDEIASQKDTLRMAAMLHDLGKLAIPNVIRQKPGRLSKEEYEMMKQHTIKGAQLLLQYASSEIEEAAAQVALSHHERWDGSGYPGHVDPHSGEVIPGYESMEGKARGKKGEEIPIFGRIVAIADVYDSLLNHRVFREAWKKEDVLKKLKSGAGSHFDPEMIDAFFECLDILQAIEERFKNE